MGVLRKTSESCTNFCITGSVTEPLPTMHKTSGLVLAMAVVMLMAVFCPPKVEARSIEVSADSNSVTTIEKRGEDNARDVCIGVCMANGGSYFNCKRYKCR